MQWYEGVSGDTSNPISGATESSYNTGSLSETAYYWVEATNPNGSANGETISVSVTPQPTVANAIDQIQPFHGTGYLIQSDQSDDGFIFYPNWQEFIPSTSYTDSIEVYLWKGVGGDSEANILVQLFDDLGYAIYTQTIVASEVAVNPGGYLSLPIKMYLNPGETYRLQMHATAHLDPDNSIDYVWASHPLYANPYVAGNSNLDSIEFYNSKPDYEGIDYTFQTKGSNASSLFTVLDPETISLAIEAITYDVDVTSNTDWTVAESLDWLSVTPTIGSNNGQVTITVETNNSSETRTGMVNIGGVDHIVTQTTDSSTVSISPQSKTVDAIAEPYNIEVTTLGGWSASANENWLSVSPASGVGSGVFSVTTDANVLGQVRLATITVGSEVHSIRQNGVFSNESIFEEWLAAHFLSDEITAMNPNSKRADSDGDGLENFDEMTLGHDPNVAGENAALEISQESEDSLTLTLAPYNSLLTYSVYASEDLLAWTKVTPINISINTNSISFEVSLDGNLTYRVSAVE